MRRRSEKKRKAHENKHRRGGSDSSRPNHHDGHQDGRKKKRGKPGGPRNREFKQYTGRIQKNPSGFAFIIPSESRLADVYVSREQALSLLNDDVVEFTVRHQGGRTSAEIKRVLKRGQTEVLGVVSLYGHEKFVETREGALLEIVPGKKRPEVGDWVIARFEEYPRPNQRGLVSIVQFLGPELLPEHDIVIATARFNLPRDFDARAMEEAFSGRLAARRELNEPSESRRDLRDLPFVTIDGEDAKDFDDAVLVTTPSQESPFVLYVAIADVSFFVRPSSVLDEEALGRSTSVYFPGYCLPMLPEGLSNDLCSLRPRTDRLTLTAEMHFDRDGNILRTEFYESIICTARRLTYTEVQRFFDHHPETRENLKDLEKPLNSAHALYLKLAKKRRERGTLDFELPEGKIEVDERGHPLRAARAPRYDAHRLIEEFMISANREVAERLRTTRTPTLYRVHEPPDPQCAQDVNHLLRRLGISKEMKDASPKSFSRLLESTVGIKGAATLHQTILRLQKQARYEPEPKGHFGLALTDYCHFTSPIRRYPDLVVHRSLKTYLKSQDEYSEKNSDPTDLESLEQLGQETSEKERRAMEAERYVTKRKQCWYLMDKIGEQFNGTISGVISAGVFVALPEFAIDGFLPISSLPGTYDFDEKRLCLLKRPGHQMLTVGDEIQIRVERVNLEDNEITFGPATTAGTRA